MANENKLTPINDPKLLRILREEWRTIVVEFEEKYGVTVMNEYPEGVMDIIDPWARKKGVIFIPPIIQFYPRVRQEIEEKAKDDDSIQEGPSTS